MALGGVSASSLPNIVVIFADDMGVGDVSHNGGVVPTPALDKLASNGMRLTDAHTTSAVCTPSRYGLMTGRYNWRTRLQSSVFFHPLSLPLIEKDEQTLATLLKEAGYYTGMVGKWHMGYKWTRKRNFKQAPHMQGAGWEIDFTKAAGSPLRNGFDYHFGILASLDMPPYVYIDQDLAVSNPTVSKGYMKSNQGSLLSAAQAEGRIGPADPSFTAEGVLPTFSQKSVEFIQSSAAKEQPFFLYLSLTSPHTPHTPSAQWQGRSGINTYGDFLMETDWVVGQVQAALEESGVADETFVLFSADNGASPKADFKKLAEYNHFPSGPLRGTKADIFEGGHRVPTIVSWPGKVEAGTSTDRLISLADVYATIADIIGEDSKEAADSISFLPTIMGEAQDERSAIVMHSFRGTFAIRQGDWKLCFGGGSGGFSHPAKHVKGTPKWQLYNLANDIGEATNLYDSHPGKVKELHALMMQYIENGRSTTGKPLKNAVEIRLEKKGM